MVSIEESAARSDALDVLAYVLAWELTPGRWAEVTQLVADLAAAAASHDLAAMRHATRQLDRLTPLRAVTKIESAQQAADDLRFRVNRLIHDLNATPADGDGKAGKADDQRLRGS